MRPYRKEEELFKYEIGGKTYIQRPLVLGQIRQLIGQLGGLKIYPGSGGVGIIFGLGEKLPSLLAVALTEEGKSPKEKNVEEMAKEIEFEIDPETAIKVVEDFFVCNPTSSILERIGKLRKLIKTKTGSKSSSSSSPEETSSKETPSSGDILPENASPSSDIASEA